MKMKSLLTLAAAASALACALPASATISIFSATLNGATESPAVVTPAFGLALVTFDDVLFTVSVNEIFVGLIGGAASAGHIHCCTAVAGTGNVAVVVPFTGFPAVTTGSYTNTFALTSAVFTPLLAGTVAGKAYVNIHNLANPGGEIRGFLVAAPVPEPGTYALMLAGIAAIGWVARKRQQS